MLSHLYPFEYRKYLNCYFSTEDPLRKGILFLKVSKTPDAMKSDPVAARGVYLKVILRVPVRVEDDACIRCG